jgi:hypothetical protein
MMTSAVTRKEQKIFFPRPTQRSAKLQMWLTQTGANHSAIYRQANQGGSGEVK